MNASHRIDGWSPFASHSIQKPIQSIRFAHVRCGGLNEQTNDRIEFMHLMIIWLRFLFRFLEETDNTVFWMHITFIRRAHEFIGGQRNKESERVHGWVAKF